MTPPTPSSPYEASPSSSFQSLLSRPRSHISPNRKLLILTTPHTNQPNQISEYSPSFRSLFSFPQKRLYHTHPRKNPGDGQLVDIINMLNRNSGGKTRVPLPRFRQHKIPFQSIYVKGFFIYKAKEGETGRGREERGSEG